MISFGKILLFFVSFFAFFKDFFFENEVQPLPTQKLPNEKKIKEHSFHFIRDISRDEEELNFPFVETNERRNLGNVLTDPTIIPIDPSWQNAWQLRRVYRYIFGKLNRFKSEVIEYPYPFSFAKEGEESNFERGAFLKTGDFREYFKYLQAEGDFNFGQARALYDTNIGVLKIQKEYNGQMTELLYEADSYCDIFLTFLGHYGKECVHGDVYRTLEDKSQTRLVYLAEDQLDVLFEEENKFQILIIPDIILGAEDFILKQLGSSGKEMIRKFVNEGGKIYVSGKSGLLLEDMGLIQKGTYKQGNILISETNEATIKGCEDQTLVTSNNYADYVKETLCFGVTKDNSNVYLLSSFFMDENKVKLSGMNEIMYFESIGLSKKNTNTGFREGMTAEEKNYLPMTLHKTFGKGEITFCNAFPAHTLEHVHFFFNSIFQAMGKNLYLNTEVVLQNGNKDLPIPGNEAGVILKIENELKNLFSDSIDNVKMNFWIPPLVDILSIKNEDGNDLNCQFNITTNIPETIQPLNPAGYSCNFGTINPTSNKKLVIEIEIMDGSVTRRKNNIQMMYSRIEYKNSRTKKEENFEIGGFFVNAKAAALLKPSVNPDPSSFYPIHGRGDYVDNVVKTINVEHTEALEVEYVAILPLITPAVDGDSQNQLIELVEFWNDYYKKSTNGIGDYSFPLKNNNDYDIIDFNFLSDKNCLLNANWDTSIKLYKATVDLSQPNRPITTIYKDLTTTNTNAYVVNKQLHFADSKKFFEHGSQQNIIMIDPTKENGALAYYPTGIPSNIKKISNPSVAKSKFIFVRSDIYFYYTGEEAQYTQPFGLDFKDVISIDKYKTTFPQSQDCSGAFPKVLENGYFDSTQPGGLKPNEYANGILNNCGGPLYTDVNGVSHYRSKVDINEVMEKSGGNITKTHYLMPMTTDDIKRPGDIFNFIEVSEDYGYHNEYEDLQYIKAYEGTFLLSPELTRLGGKLEIILPSGITFKDIDPIANQRVTFTADHIAIHTITYDKNERKISVFFTRGWQSNERWGKDSGIRMNLENLDITFQNFTGSMKIYELKYDISSPINNERYILTDTRDLLLIKKAFMSFPALKLLMKVNRGGSNAILPYETLEPMSRYGFYFQELEKHRTVWGLAESHHISDPGLTSKNAGFSLISQVGISSIPFLEYLTAGKAQLIPSSTETSRVIWKDIWGRKFAEPVRSVYPDVPPIPPPLRNFMLSTTFEITDQENGERLFEWDGESTVDITLKLKLLNNYPKHFDMTTCKANSVFSYVTENSGNYYGISERIYADSPEHQIFGTNDDTSHIDSGYKAFYGECFAEDGTIIQGQKLTANQFTTIAKHCNKHDQPDQCEKDLIAANIPQIKRVDSSSSVTGSNWIYSPQIHRYYPKNLQTGESYIKDNMWDLTHYDYDDTVFDISYKYFMANWLPSSDKSTLYKPHNIIVQPIFKGFGYMINYKKDHGNKRNPNYTGWWSDNLQNKDNTLLAGKNCYNDVSVDKDSCLNENDWILIHELKNSSVKVIDRSLSNIYQCLFNRKRLKVDLNSDIKSVPANVHINNIVPVKYKATWNDYSKFNCNLKTGMYYPHNISNYDENYIKTTGGRDWMYFAANLRGGAKETLNIVTELQAYAGALYEGDTKINEGGRFVYWNPANGPNSFLIVDSEPNIIKSIRSDLSVDVELFPKSSEPFNSEIYHLIEIKDIEEIDRQFKDSYYINHKGFGDSSSWVYVGGVDGTKAIVEPGKNTFVRVTLVNNCGFDWNMKIDAILTRDIDVHAYSANDLLNGIKHTIQEPLEYKFLTVVIPDDIKPYVQISPSNHNIRVSPLFFDFQSINIATIRDGYRGDYYFNVSIDPLIPSHLTGKLYDFKIILNEQFFDRLPNYNDPTSSGFHDYQFSIPSFQIGIPFTSGENKGKIYYFSGFSQNIQYTHMIGKEYEIEGARYLKKKRINELRDNAAQHETSFQNLRKFWKSLENNTIDYIIDQQKNIVDLQIINKYPQLPIQNIENPEDPHEAEIYILLKTYGKQVPFGTIKAVEDSTLTYNDYQNKHRLTTMSEPNYRSVNIKGAYLDISYFISIVENNGNETWFNFKDSNSQFLYPKQEGYFKILIKTNNIGDGIAYDVQYLLHFDRNIEIIENTLESEDFIIQPSSIKQGGIDLIINTKHDISPGNPDSRIYYVKYYPHEELLNRTDFHNFPKERVIVDGMDSTMYLSDFSKRRGIGKKVTQNFNKQIKFSYILRKKDTVTLSGKLNKKEKMVQLFAKVNQKDILGNPIQYIYYWTNKTTGIKTILNITTDDYYQFYYQNDNNENAEYQVTTIDPITKNTLASDSWYYVPWAFLVTVLMVVVPFVFGMLIIAIIAIIGFVFIWNKKKKIDQKRANSLLMDNPYTKLEEPQIDLKDILSEFKGDGKTAFVYEGKRVSVRLDKGKIEIK